MANIRNHFLSPPIALFQIYMQFIEMGSKGVFSQLRSASLLRDFDNLRHLGQTLLCDGSDPKRFFKGRPRGADHADDQIALVEFG